MIAAIIFAIIVVVVIPVGFLMSTMVVAAIMGASLKVDAEHRHEGSELLDNSY